MFFINNKSSTRKIYAICKSIKLLLTSIRWPSGNTLALCAESLDLKSQASQILVSYTVL